MSCNVKSVFVPNPNAALAAPPASVPTKGKAAKPRNTLFPLASVITKLGAPERAFSGIRAAEWSHVRSGIRLEGWLAACKADSNIPRPGLGFITLLVDKGLAKVSAAPKPAIAVGKAPKAKSVPAAIVAPATVQSASVSV
jgi:hypothetical protein